MQGDLYRAKQKERQRAGMSEDKPEISRILSGVDDMRLQDAYHSSSTSTNQIEYDVDVSTNAPRLTVHPHLTNHTHLTVHPLQTPIHALVSLWLFITLVGKRYIIFPILLHLLLHQAEFDADVSHRGQT
jgi:hypothetical protein